MARRRAHHAAAVSTIMPPATDRGHAQPCVSQPTGRAACDELVPATIPTDTNPIPLCGEPYGPPAPAMGRKLTSRAPGVRRTARPLRTTA
jgi:hypothetical protein